MAVVDASVVVGFLCGEVKVTDRLEVEEHVLWAPHLIDAEIGHALRRKVLLGQMDAEAAEHAICAISDLPLRRFELENLVQGAWDLRAIFTFHEALYVALALKLGETLLTFDGRLARSGLDVPVEVLAQ